LYVSNQTLHIHLEIQYVAKVLRINAQQIQISQHLAQ